MGRQSIWEYFRSVCARYRQAAREVKRKMLGEFCANMGYRRKYALRLLNWPPPGRARPHPDHPVRRRPTYGRFLGAQPAVDLAGADRQQLALYLGVEMKMLSHPGVGVGAAGHRAGRRLIPGRCG